MGRPLCKCSLALIACQKILYAPNNLAAIHSFIWNLCVARLLCFCFVLKKTPTDIFIWGVVFWTPWLLSRRFPTDFRWCSSVFCRFWLFAWEMMMFWVLWVFDVQRCFVQLLPSRPLHRQVSIENHCSVVIVIYRSVKLYSCLFQMLQISSCLV